MLKAAWLDGVQTAIRNAYRSVVDDPYARSTVVGGGLGMGAGLLLAYVLHKKRLHEGKKSSFWDSSRLAIPGTFMGSALGAYLAHRFGSTGPRESVDSGPLNLSRSANAAYNKSVYNPYRSWHPQVYSPGVPTMGEGITSGPIDLYQLWHRSGTREPVLNTVADEEVFIPKFDIHRE